VWQRHKRAVARGDASVRDGARRCNSGLSAGQHWGTARGWPVDRNCTDERHEAGAEEGDGFGRVPGVVAIGCITVSAREGERLTCGVLKTLGLAWQ
jgi:hypothetical protein